MTTAWIAYGLLVGGFLVVAAHAADHVCRIVGQPTRWVWAGALLLLVTLVGMAPYRRAVFSDLKPGVSDAIALSGDKSRGESDRDHSLVGNNLMIGGSQTLLRWIVAKMDHVIVWAGQGVPSHWSRSFGVIWGSLSLLLLGMFATVSWRLHRARSGWRASELHGVPVLITPGTGPVVIGVFHPTIVVPSWLLDCNGEEQRLVVAHEREHVRAYDSLLLMVACFGVILLPWNPAVWWIFSRLRLAVELDCDRRVLRQGVAPRVYGAVLIDLARRSPRLAVNAPALADRASHLKQRIIAMNPSRLPYPRLFGIALSGVAGAALIVACATEVQAQEPNPTTSKTITPGAAGAPAQVRIRGIVGTNANGDPFIVVDGVRLYPKQTNDSAATKFSVLNSIDADNIETIEVLKGLSAVSQYGADAANGVIVIKTKRGHHK